MRADRVALTAEETAALDRLLADDATFELGALLTAAAIGHLRARAVAMRQKGRLLTMWD